MNQLYPILFEITFFLALAALYYIYKKKKILKDDLWDNFEQIQSLSSKSKISIDVELLNSQRIEDLINHLENNQNHFNKQDQIQIENIIKNLKYHLKNH